MAKFGRLHLARFVSLLFDWSELHSFYVDVCRPSKTVYCSLVNSSTRPPDTDNRTFLHALVIYNPPPHHSPSGIASTSRHNVDWRIFPQHQKKGRELISII